MRLSDTVVRKEYLIEDEGGYSADVVAINDPEWGWSASVAFTANGGFITAEDAVCHLRHAAEHFLRQLEELEAKQ